MKFIMDDLGPVCVVQNSDCHVNDECIMHLYSYGVVKHGRV